MWPVKYLSELMHQIILCWSSCCLMAHLLIVAQILLIFSDILLICLFCPCPHLQQDRPALGRGEQKERYLASPAPVSIDIFIYIRPFVLPSVHSVHAQHIYCVHISEKPSTITVIHPDLVTVKVYTAFTNFYCTSPVKYYASHWPLAEGCGNTEGRAGTVFFLGNS